MKTLHLRVTLTTGNDDLRGESWADFLFKDAKFQAPLVLYPVLPFLYIRMISSCSDYNVGCFFAQ